MDEEAIPNGGVTLCPGSREQIDSRLTSQVLIDNAWCDCVLGVCIDKHGRGTTGKVWVDTDYQYVFSVFDEISDHLQNHGCLRCPRWTKQLENVPAFQTTTKKVVNRRTTTKDVIAGIQQSGCGLGRRQSRANRQDLLRRLDGYA